MFVQLTKPFLNRQPGERIDLADADARSLIDQQIAVPVPGDLITPAVSKALENAFSKLTQSLDGIVTTTLQHFADAQGQARRHAVPLLFGDGKRGDPEHNFADWLFCVRHGNVERLTKEYGSELGEVSRKAALNTGVGTQGGFTVPVEFLDRLLMAAAEIAIARPRANVIPMSSRSIQVPVLDIVTVPAVGDTAFFGSLAARWTEEAAAETESEPTFKQIELVAHELSGYSKVSNQLAADSPLGLEALLINLFGKAIAWYEDAAFLNGNGVGKPLGAISSASGAAKSITRNAANAFQLVDAAKMLGALLPGWTPRSTCWVIHPTVLQQVVQMTTSAAGVAWMPNLRDQTPMTLLGLPICLTEKLQPLGTARDVALIDFQHYLIGDRKQIDIAYSEHVAFTNNQGVWRFVCRVDGQPWLRGPVTLSDGTSTLSPYVFLT